MLLIAQGAEAKVYDNENEIVKTRISKPYRIHEIDNKLIKSRTKREAKILTKLYDSGVTVPRVLKVEGNSIHMEKIQGHVLKEYINGSNYEEVMRLVGGLVYKMHKLNIIHGDLTTLNFMHDGRIVILDFGLSFFSFKDEDKAVDLYVFEKALRCAHDEACVKAFYDGYTSTKEETSEVMKKLEAVRKRGRKREETAFG